jgi:hypothetical protein
MSNLWALRAAESDDLPFIFSSLLKSHRNNSTVSGVSNSIYYDQQHKLVSNLLQNPTSIVIVSCDSTDPKTIFGYIVAEVAQDAVILHYVYVKHAVRGFGMARALVSEVMTIPHTSVTYTSRNRNIKDPTWVYNPYKLWEHI